MSNQNCRETIMVQVNVREAKDNLSRLLAMVEAGEEVVIARNGVPVARLVPQSQRSERRNLGSGRAYSRSLTASLIRCRRSLWPTSSHNRAASARYLHVFLGWVSANADESKHIFANAVQNHADNRASTYSITSSIRAKYCSIATYVRATH